MVKPLRCWATWVSSPISPSLNFFIEYVGGHLGGWNGTAGVAVDSSVSGILEPTVGRAGAPPGTSAAPGGPLSSLQYCALPDTDAGGGSSYARCWPVMIRGLCKLG